MGLAANSVKQKSWLKVSVERLPYNTCKCFYDNGLGCLFIENYIKL